MLNIVLKVFLLNFKQTRPRGHNLKTINSIFNSERAYEIESFNMKMKRYSSPDLDLHLK